MNKFILISFLLACVGVAIAGYGSGTPGYYDPWTYYGGYDRYNNRYRYQARPYYPISRYGGSGSRGSSYGSSYGSGSQSQTRPYYPVRYDGYDRSSTSSRYNRGSQDERMYDNEN